jgi:GntR family transcriptional regulator, carbon starvation induced regulator
MSVAVFGLRLPTGPVVLDTEWSSRHREFHLALIAACRSERLLTWSSSLFDQAERCRHFSAHNRLANKQKNAEHRMLMKAVIKRDAKLSIALLTEHTKSTQRNVLAAFKLAKTF